LITLVFAVLFVGIFYYTYKYYSQRHIYRQRKLDEAENKKEQIKGIRTLEDECETLDG